MSAYLEEAVDVFLANEFMSREIMDARQVLEYVDERGRFALGIRSDDTQSLYPLVAERFEHAHTADELRGVVSSLLMLDARGELGSTEPFLYYESQLKDPERFRESLRQHFFPYSD